ncbi:MAG: hypothetical protein F6K19_48460 [Cyanothece sp. SIO1E1]|nr:hypothetical protein [Cyanothece sp. SIO1E1]
MTTQEFNDRPLIGTLSSQDVLLVTKASENGAPYRLPVSQLHTFVGSELDQRLTTLEENQDAKASKTVQPWIAAVLVNGWSQGDDPAHRTPSFRKTDFGMVSLTGSVRATFSGLTVVFVLPQGYRPPFKIEIPAARGGGNARVVINPLGELSILGVGPGTAYVELSSIHFFVD